MKKRAATKGKLAPSPKQKSKPQPPPPYSTVPPSAAEILRAAKLYYRDGLTKSEIANDVMNIDTRKVALLLKQAVDLGVVTIIFRETRESQLEDQLLYKYQHLHKVFVVSSEKIDPKEQPDKYRDLLKSWASVVADYFEEQVNNAAGKDVHVGCTGGETALEIVSRLPERRRENVYVHVTAIVGRGQLENSAAFFDPIMVASALWLRSGRLPAHLEFTTTAPYHTDRARRAPQDLHKSVTDVLKNMDSLDIIIGGIGIVPPPPKPSTGQASSRAGIDTGVALGLPLAEETYNELVSKGCIGEMSYNWITPDGKNIEGGELFLTAGYGTKYPGIEWYTHMATTPGKKVIVAAGPGKIAVIRAALAAKAFNVFITDQHSAAELVHGS